MLRIARYGNSRFWALYDGPDLVVVTVYKRGAREVQRRLAAQPAQRGRATEPPLGQAGRRRDQRERPSASPLQPAGAPPRPTGALGFCCWHPPHLCLPLPTVAEAHRLPLLGKARHFSGQAVYSSVAARLPVKASPAPGCLTGRPGHYTGLPAPKNSELPPQPPRACEGFGGSLPPSSPSVLATQQEPGATRWQPGQPLPAGRWPR